MHVAQQPQVHVALVGNLFSCSLFSLQGEPQNGGKTLAGGITLGNTTNFVHVCELMLDVASFPDHMIYGCSIIPRPHDLRM